MASNEALIFSLLCLANSSVFFFKNPLREPNWRALITDNAFTVEIPHMLSILAAFVAFHFEAVFSVLFAALNLLSILYLYICFFLLSCCLFFCCLIFYSFCCLDLHLFLPIHSPFLYCLLFLRPFFSLWDYYHIGLCVWICNIYIW